MAHTPQVNEYQHERQITDPQTDLNADVAAFAGVNRLRVEAIIAAGGILDEDVDDDSIAAGQTLLLSIVLNYQFDGTVQRRVQARAANTAIDQSLMYTLVRAALSGVDAGAAAGSEVVAIGADTVSASTMLQTDNAIEVIAKLYAEDSGGASTNELLSEVVSSISGLTSGARALITAAVACGVDNTGAEVLRPVEARDYDAVADVASTLIGLLVNSRNSIFRVNSSDWTQAEGDLYSVALGGIPTTGRIGQYTTAVNFGVDNTGAAVLAAVEARDFTASGDVTQSLIGLLVNSRASLRNHNSGDWTFWNSDQPNNADGKSNAVIVGAYANAVTFGVDTTGAAVLAAIEGRDFGAVGDVANTLIGLLVNNRNAIFNGGSSDWALQTGWEETDGSARVLAGSLPWRESGFPTSIQGRRFSFNPAATAIAGTTSFTATAPQVIIVGGATNDHVIRKIRLSLSVAGGTPPVFARLVIDTADRYTSGGTARTPSNQNTASATAAGGDHYVDSSGSAIVATAAGGGTREISTRVFSNAVGAEIEWEFKDGLILGVSDSLLLYWHDSGGSAPSALYDIEFEEANVQ